jgi:DeoR family glycerol-3-phosphate regulon repressor
MDSQVRDLMTERQQKIVEIVQQQGFATIENLARDFGVSSQSVRRDIIKLDADGLLQRFHGGVGVRETAGRLDYVEKRNTATEAKRRIGVKAASMIPEGSVVFLDVGTTVESVADALRDKKVLRVFTSSIAAAALLAGRPGIDLFILGGSVRGIDGSIVGETTIAALSRFHFDYAVIGFSGIGPDGAIMDYDLEKVAVKEAAIVQAGSTLLVGDSSKFRKAAVVRFETNTKSLALVTEIQPGKDLAEKLRCEVVLAD